MKFALRVALFVVACCLMAYGGTMMFFVPAPLGHYFDRNLVLYGITPLVTSLSLFATVGALSAKQNSSSGAVVRSIAQTTAFGVTAVIALYLVVVVIAALRPT